MKHLFIMTILAVLAYCPDRCIAQGRAAAIREGVEFMIRQFGKEAAEVGTPALTRKLESLAAKHGDDAVRAAAKAGPTSIKLIEEAGEHPPEEIKLFAKHGDEAIWVVSQPNRLAIFVKHGDDAASAMMKHKAVIEPMLTNIGKPAGTALNSVGTRCGRNLTNLHADGFFTQVAAKSDDLLAIISKYGDRAADFIWKNKGALVVAGALTAFVANPEPFLDDVADITKFTIEKVAEVASVPVAETTKEIASKSNITYIVAAIGIVVGIGVVLRLTLKKSRKL